MTHTEESLVAQFGWSMQYVFNWGRYSFNQSELDDDARTRVGQLTQNVGKRLDEIKGSILIEAAKMPMHLGTDTNGDFFTVAIETHSLKVDPSVSSEELIDALAHKILSIVEKRGGSRLFPYVLLIPYDETLGQWATRIGVR